jgi:3-oxoacyl-[acyl-carrier-protein] synthase II
MTACLLEAAADAGIDPADVRYVNFHGTATKSNDPAEATAIRKVFGITSKPAGAGTGGRARSGRRPIRHRRPAAGPGR